MEKEIFELMTKMYNEIQDMTSQINKINSRMNSLETKITDGFVHVNNRFDELSVGIGKIVADEVAGEISNQLSEIKTDVKFITRKVQDTEKDVFVIQNHLKVIK